jgi:hypothetical protein
LPRRQVALVGLVAVLVGGVLVAEDGHRADAEFGAGTEDADRDLAAVGAEDLVGRRAAGGLLLGVRRGRLLCEPLPVDE